ncbi:D-beta-hydroxybutyrate dehydrogenase, mitochondrial isoform X1 [Prionailurus viverrinus]|uniref:D-beta-hydroxybutyrate dehydrogenase, mitochondrial n=5 Tax=Felinae TaxID=338152 RepID=A0ABI7XA18_FELCA|nr:D-beta-hydroxybutyrate dehydrogenase, mitochondrial isoform X1 [Felis catus]XP_026916950.1 D-beta-hydroxybutyrate dehydrogenase, mitochondrial isoform X1 [Acinonyx jubatus]XP_047731636.1 D-beta-hydroxybutyrate dehydrogenase, mitochondrial isoform X1 [Prionailurus viverrinus]
MRESVGNKTDKAPGPTEEDKVKKQEPPGRRLTILPLVAIMLTARLFRPLSQLPGKTLSLCDREKGTRRMLLLYSASPVPVSLRTYSDEVNPVGSKAVLVTGCDSGFGFSLAKHLHSRGFLVFAGCLMKDKGNDGVKELDSLKSDRLRTVQLNVCKSEEVDKVVEIVRSSLEDPEKGMWGLVNNAGISTFGEVEFTSMETYKEVAEVNLWGTVRMTKSFLPLIRRAKGRIVNISSMLGRMANPARSPYCITKFGVEAFSDCLRYEMYPLGVKVSVVEPGNFIAATSLYSPERIQAIANKMWEELPEVVRKDYGRKYFDEKIAKMETYCNSGSTDTSPVIKAVTHALTSATPYTRYHPMDYYWWLRMQIMTHLPGAVSDRIYIH